MKKLSNMDFKTIVVELEKETKYSEKERKGMFGETESFYIESAIYSAQFGIKAEFQNSKIQKLLEGGYEIINITPLTCTYLDSIGNCFTYTDKLLYHLIKR